MPVAIFPSAPHFTPPPVTKEDLDWATLAVVDLSDANNPEKHAQFVSAVRDAMHRDGFLYVVNHGYTQQENSRMLDIADVPFTQVPEEEKRLYISKPRETGLWEGYKMRQFFHVDNGVHDQMEWYGFAHRGEMQQHPQAVRPFVPEVAAFREFNNNRILLPMLRALATGLELPEDTFVDMHAFKGRSSRSWMRFQKYFPYSEDDAKRANDVWVKGHTDLGFLTILWSQPVSALQIKSRNGEWRWVRHIENALVLNVGDSLEMLSGGFYKAAIHRVVQPPRDQRCYDRLGIFYFTVAQDDVKLAPLMQSGVLQRLGSAVVRKCADEDAPTMRQWMDARVKNYGTQKGLEKNADGTEDEEILKGFFTKHYN